MTARTLLAAAIAFFILGGPVSADTTHAGKNYSATVGDDGMLKSFKVGSTEMLRAFAGRTSACVVFQRGGKQTEVTFESVTQTPRGTVKARHPEFVLEYEFAPEGLKIHYQSLVLGKHFYVFWRPAEAVHRAVDGEDDTTVNTVKTWYNDMVDARWVADSGEVLTFGMKGNWSRYPYTAKGAPCYGPIVYARHKGTWTLNPETVPGPKTALVFEVMGENPDFLPPGGAPAVFPCKAENLGREKLDFGYRVRVVRYYDRAAATAVDGKFKLPGRGKAVVPLTLDLKAPGMYRCELDLTHGGKMLKQKVWNFCYDFANWKPVCARPADFDAFWQKTLAELDTVPVDLKKAVISEDSKSTLYKVNFAVLNGKRCYAWLRVPKAVGKLPGRLMCPSSGVNNLPAPRTSGYVDMVIAIHGYDVDKSDFPKKPPFPWPGTRYHNFGLERKEKYFYRDVYARCARAVDVLKSLSQVDPKRIVVSGGSQGGGLSIVTAALRPEVALCTPGASGMCRFDWTVKYGVGTWPLNRDDIPKGQTLEQMLETLSYFDVANFAGQVKCPIVASVGGMDTITASGGQFAALAQADKDNLTIFNAPWGRHGANARTQQLFFRSHREFQAGKPISLPKTWLAREK